MKTEFRIRITDTLGNRSYIVRSSDGKVTYLGGNETPLALANFVGNEAAELRFALRDARTTSIAMAAIEKARVAYTRLARGQDATKVEVI